MTFGKTPLGSGPSFMSTSRTYGKTAGKPFQPPGRTERSRNDRSARVVDDVPQLVGEEPDVQRVQHGAVQGTAKYSSRWRWVFQARLRPGRPARYRGARARAPGGRRAVTSRRSDTLTGSVGRERHDLRVALADGEPPPDVVQRELEVVLHEPLEHRRVLSPVFACERRHSPIPVRSLVATASNASSTSVRTSAPSGRGQRVAREEARLLDLDRIGPQHARRPAPRARSRSSRGDAAARSPSSASRWYLDVLEPELLAHLATRGGNRWTRRDAGLPRERATPGAARRCDARARSSRRGRGRTSRRVRAGGARASTRR